MLSAHRDLNSVFLVHAYVQNGLIHKYRPRDESRPSPCELEYKGFLSKCSLLFSRFQKKSLKSMFEGFQWNYGLQNFQVNLNLMQNCRHNFSKQSKEREPKRTDGHSWNDMDRLRRKWCMLGIKDWVSKTLEVFGTRHYL